MIQVFVTKHVTDVLKKVTTCLKNTRISEIFM